MPQGPPAFRGGSPRRSPTSSVRIGSGTPNTRASTTSGCSVNAALDLLGADALPRALDHRSSSGRGSRGRRSRPRFRGRPRGSSRRRASWRSPRAGPEVSEHHVRVAQGDLAEDLAGTAAAVVHDGGLDGHHRVADVVVARSPRYRPRCRRTARPSRSSPRPWPAPRRSAPRTARSRRGSSTLVSGCRVRRRALGGLEQQVEMGGEQDGVGRPASAT